MPTPKEIEVVVPRGAHTGINFFLRIPNKRFFNDGRLGVSPSGLRHKFIYGVYGLGPGRAGISFPRKGHWALLGGDSVAALGQKVRHKGLKRLRWYTDMGHLVASTSLKQSMG